MGWLNVFDNELISLHNDAFELVTQRIVRLGTRDDLAVPPSHVVTPVLLLELGLVNGSHNMPPQCPYGDRACATGTCSVRSGRISPVAIAWTRLRVSAR